MAFKATHLLLLSLIMLISWNASAQTASTNANPGSFYSVTRNKAWVVNQYLITTTQADKKSLFTNSTFRFNEVDTSMFLIETVGTNSMKGYWKAQDDNNVIFSLPLIVRDSTRLFTTSATSSANASSIYNQTPPKESPSDSAYNEVAKMLSGGLMHIIDIDLTKIKLRLQDAMRGEVFIELIRKD